MKTIKCNSRVTTGCTATLTADDIVKPDHGWKWSDKYGWNCPQHPAPSGSVYSNKLTCTTSWGTEISFITDRQDLPQSYIDLMARKAGQLPPSRMVPGCPTCEAVGVNGPRHYGSVLCQSGGRPHCTCDVCF